MPGVLTSNTPPAPGRTTKLVTLDELAAMVPDGARLGIGGVHLSRLPLALVRKVLALGRKDFVFTSWGGGLPLEMLLAAKAVRKLIFCFSSLDIFGLSPRFREALEKNQIEVEEWTALAMMQGLHTGAMFRGPRYHARRVGARVSWVRILVSGRRTADRQVRMCNEYRLGREDRKAESPFGSFPGGLRLISDHGCEGDGIGLDAC